MPQWLEILVAVCALLFPLTNLIAKGSWWAGGRVSKVDQRLERLEKRATRLEIKVFNGDAWKA